MAETLEHQVDSHSLSICRLLLQRIILLAILKKSGNLFFLMCINIIQVGVARLLFFLFKLTFYLVEMMIWSAMIEWMHRSVPKCSLTQNKRIIQNNNWLNWKFINTFIFWCKLNLMKEHSLNSSYIWKLVHRYKLINKLLLLAYLVLNYN